MVASSPASLLEGLNPEQQEAVTHGEGPLLVLAGAGSGKTRVLTRRLAWVVAHGVPQEGVVAVTFTNKAAGEMKERVGQLLGVERPRSFVGTFHAWCVRLLRRFHQEAGLRPGFVVFDTDDQLAIVKRAMKELAVPEKTFTPRGAQSKISHAKNARIHPDEFPKRWGDYQGSILLQIQQAYEKGLEKAGALDFDDLLLRSARLLREKPAVLDLLKRSVRHLLVDEYQDTNAIQAELVQAIAGPAGNVFAVGDEDQSIYRWRGADVSNILEFTKRFPGARTVRLERNYRSTAPILAAAGAVVAVNERRLGKTLRATKSGGDPVKVLIVDEERDEAREVVSRILQARRGNPGVEVAVLFRTNAQSRPFEDELLRNNQAYQLVGGTKFYERAEIKDALAYLRLARNPGDDVSFRRVVNVPARGIGAATLEALEAAARQGDSGLFAALELPLNGLTDRARRALGEFHGIVERLRAASEGSASEAVSAALNETGLAKLYEESDDPQDEARRENLDELLTAAREHERASEDTSLAAFLDAVTLRADADEVDEKRGIVLMTLHAAKGLEFHEVFVAGMEEGSLPHASCREDDEIEEERRLAYVGMTRARERLTLSRALRRMVHGEWTGREPSPFLDALPRKGVVVEDLSTRRFAGPERSFGGGSSLFPDYENESQEEPAPARRFPAAPRRGVYTPRPAMKRTPAPPTASGFKRGARVKHPEYGVGVVLAIEGSGENERLTVYFDRAGRKKFVARFANLSPG